MTLCVDRPAKRPVPEPTVRPVAKRPARSWITARGVVRVGVLLVVLGIATLTLRDRLPDGTAVLAALRSADAGWLALAAVAIFVSMGMFARQQRRLLTAFGVTLARHRALALAFSRSAMSISLPAGSVVSAGYAFRQFLAGGADKRAATTVMVLSGVISAAALVVLYASGVLASTFFDISGAWQANPTLALTACAMLVVTIGFLVRYASRSVATRHWVLALAAAVANWSADLLCLIFVAHAFDLPVSLAALGVVYLTVQIVRQIPLTPGGIGVIEASLLAGLVSAGAGDAAAAATVVTYRLLSCWLIIPVGFIGWLVLRRSAAAQMS